MTSTFRSPILPLLLPLGLLLGSCNSTTPKVDKQALLDMHRDQALGYYEAGALGQAEDQIRKGLDIDPKDDNLKLMLGWCRQRRGTRDDLNVAERVFRDLAPRKDYRALLGLAECLERKGKLYAETADRIEAGEAETPSADPKERALELRNDTRKFWKEALTHYQAVLEQKPTEGQAMNGLQRTHALLDEPEESLAWGGKLLAQSQSELDFWQNQLKRPDLGAKEEAQLRERMTVTREVCVATHFLISAHLVRLDRKAEAVEHLDAIVEMTPEESVAYSRRGQILHDLGRYEEARANLDDFLRITELPFDHPFVQRAFETKSDCERRLQALGGGK